MHNTAENAQEWYVKKGLLSTEAALDLTEIQRGQLLHKGMEKILEENLISLADLLEIIKTPLPAYVLQLLERRPMARYIEGILRAVQETGDSVIEKLRELFWEEEGFFTKLEFASHKGIRVRSLQGYLAASKVLGGLALTLEELIALEDHQIQNLYVFLESANTGEALGSFLREDFDSLKPEDISRVKENSTLLKQILQLPREINETDKEKLILMINRPWVKARLKKHLWRLDEIFQVINSLPKQNFLDLVKNLDKAGALQEVYNYLEQYDFSRSGSFSAFLNLTAQAGEILDKEVLTLPQLTEIFHKLASRTAPTEMVIRHLLSNFPLPHPCILSLLCEEERNIELLLDKISGNPQLTQKLSSILSIPEIKEGVRDKVWSLPQIFQIIEPMPPERVAALSTCLAAENPDVFYLAMIQILQPSTDFTRSLLTSFPLQAPQLLNKGALTLPQILELLDLTWGKPTFLNQVLEHLGRDHHLTYPHIQALCKEAEDVVLLLLETIEKDLTLTREINAGTRSLNEIIENQSRKQIRLQQAQEKIRALERVLPEKQRRIIAAEIERLEDQLRREKEKLRRQNITAETIVNFYLYLEDITQHKIIPILQHESVKEELTNDIILYGSNALSNAQILKKILSGNKKQDRRPNFIANIGATYHEHATECIYLLLRAIRIEKNERLQGGEIDPNGMASSCLSLPGKLDLRWLLKKVNNNTPWADVAKEIEETENEERPCSSTSLSTSLEEATLEKSSAAKKNRQG